MKVEDQKLQVNDFIKNFQKILKQFHYNLRKSLKESPLAQIKCIQESRIWVIFIIILNDSNNIIVYIGATCYMNSVIQTLFMTPEFRNHIFTQKIEVEKIKQVELSIPIQIQKLFAQLQLKNEKKINTQDLIKSFGWSSGEAFQQHDSQEFIRILFEAIDNTFKGKFINDLYQGSNINYVKCLTCKNESLREEQFLDIQLTIKNDFENIKNESIEEAFVNLMRPEMLMNENQYFCEQCQSKQNAERGCRIAKVPTIFTIQLNRFTYDYVMDRRVKLNSTFKFPYILNMNSFSNGFQGIPSEIINLFEDKKSKAYQEQVDLQQKKQMEEAQKIEEKQQKPVAQKTANEAKESTKPKPQSIKDFLKNERLKNKKEKGSKDEVEIELFTDEVKGEKYILEVNEIQNQPQQQNIPPPPPPPPIQVLESLTNQNVPPPPPINILDDNFNTGNTNIINNRIPQAPPLLGFFDDKNKPQNFINEEEQRKKDELLQEFLQYLNNSYEQHAEDCKQQINQYLKDGENVYELFSVCMHSGGAYGGHYYAFIKSFENNYWYKFNDSSVTYMELEDVLKKSVGGLDSSNGYMLFYKKYEPNKNCTFNEESIPKYLKSIIEEEEKQKAEANKVVSLKYDIDMKQKSEQMNNKSQNETNNDNKMDIQDTKSNEQLQICLPNENNLSLDDISNNKLEITNLEDINYSVTIEGLQKIICMKLNACDYKRVFIFRKIVTDDQILGQMLNILPNKSLKELGITNDEILFVEICDSEQVHQYKWVDKFDEITSTIFIKYNIPTEEEELQTIFSQLIKVDSRKSEQYLKQIICEKQKIDPNLIVLRLDGPMGREIKNMNTLIKENHLFNRKVYLQYGVPCDQNQFRNKLYIAQPQSVYENNIFFLFEEVSDIITDRNWNLDKLKENIRELLRKKDIPQYTQLYQDFEVREKYQFKMRRLYKKGLLSEQFVSDKTEFAIEFKETPVQDLELDQYKIYVRILDSSTSTLKNRFEIIAKHDNTLEDLSNTIYSHDQTVNVSEMCAILVKDVETFQFSDLLCEEWICLNNSKECIIKAPLKVSNDGQLIIIKEQSLNLKLFDLSSFKDMRIQNQKQEKAQMTRVNKIYQPKEKALKINYERNLIDQEEEQEINNL